MLFNKGMIILYEKDVKGDRTSMKDTVKCPKCSNEVMEGYIYSARRICWSESSDSVFFDFGNEVLIDKAEVKIGKIPAYRCEVCKLVIFSYE
jgi:Domain of unknown function (DUF6487)